jgi:Domain of unknown function (DUF5069)
MDPLDLTAAPPRSPYDTLLGLYVLPRTIDKMRGAMKGGHLGAYSIEGTVPGLPGLSLILLQGIKVTPEDLEAVIAAASSEANVTDWLREHADLSDIEGLNRRLIGRSLADIEAKVPRERLMQTYPFVESWPKDVSCFDIVVQDDREMFPELTD